MAKLKTHKGTAKRFKLTKKGKIKYHPIGKSHLLTGKRPVRLRHLRKAKIVKGKKNKKYLRRLLPYGKS